MSASSISGIINNTVSAVFSVCDSEEEEHLSSTPFLDSFEPNHCLANFATQEIKLGKFIRGGRFTESYQITSFRRDLSYLAASLEEEQSRLELRETAKSKGRRNYALKQVRAGLQTEREIERAALGLTIEAMYLSRLDHPNIQQIHGLSKTSYMLDQDVYEYDALITNRIIETLVQRIDHWNKQDVIAKDGDFILHLKTDYAFQIADALSYLHDRRIVFRNLTLSSIGFTTNDTIQLINFDCVKEIPQGQDYLHDGFKGNQTYAALEIYSGQQYDCKVDCFAWAICFYEMLTQEPAFTSTTNEEALIRDHGWCPSLAKMDYVPDGLLDLLEGSWETNVEERISMKDIRDELAWILFGDDDDDDDDCAAANHADFFTNTKKKRAEDDADMSASDYLPAINWDDFSAVGLDLDDSEETAPSPDCDHRRRGRQSSADQIHAAVAFSGTNNSFIPSEYLLEAPEATTLMQETTPQQQKGAVAGLLPKLESYTNQYRGLRLEPILPLSLSRKTPTSKAGSSRCAHKSPMAICA